ncbi:hypothetical protein C2G38_2203021 [Gigaspora rosea]|uniref:Uncharacterized protein n=1 Tax=Gigaspora rosea TaxID=44941 RepID=A0A397UMX5_9GLOM|nr:hypothetical protein C2G38_2203021 [Gigaspora rosea]
MSTSETDTSNDDDEIPRTEVTMASSEMAKWTKLPIPKKANINVSTREGVWQLSGPNSR